MKTLTLKSQKHQVYEQIKKLGIDSALFEWTFKPGDWADKETIKFLDPDSDYYFSITKHFDRTECALSPGSKSVTDYARYADDPGGKMPWHLIIGDIFNWLGFLKRELSVPDIWESLSEDRGIFLEPLRTGPENDQFTQELRERIIKELENIKTSLLENLQVSDDTKEKQKTLEDRIEYLIEATNRMGPKDWFMVCLGTFVTLTSALVLSPEEGKAIIGLIKSALMGLRNLLGL